MENLPLRLQVKNKMLTHKPEEPLQITTDASNRSINQPDKEKTKNIQTVMTDMY